MVLEVQIQIFGVRHKPSHVRQSFHFQKFQGAQILKFFDEKWQAASFYIKEKT